MKLAHRDASKSRIAVRVHFAFQSWQVKNHHYICLVMYEYKTFHSIWLRIEVISSRVC